MLDFFLVDFALTRKKKNKKNTDSAVVMLARV